MGLLDNYKKSQVMIKKERFTSRFDYSGFNKEDTENLLELEKKALHTGELLRDNIKELGDVFLEAQMIFANNKNGMFRKWYENLGYKKDFVYLCLDRKNLSLKYDTTEIYKLPDRVVKDIKKISLESDDAVFEILEAKDPKEKVKEIKEEIFKKEKKEVSDYELKKEKEVANRFQTVARKIATLKLSEEKIEKLLNIIDEIEKNII